MTAAQPDTFREIRDVPVELLEHWEGNANQGDVDEIRDSIERSGQYRALIVWDIDGRLIVVAGNNTLVAAVAAGRRTVRCEIHDFPSYTAALVVHLADNKIPRRAIVDPDLIVEQLSYLDGDYAGTGFTTAEVDVMLDGWPPDDLDAITATDPDAEDLADSDDQDDDVDQDGDESSSSGESAGYRCPNCDHEWTGPPRP